MQYPQLHLSAPEIAHHRELTEAFANKALAATRNHRHDRAYLRGQGYKLTQDKNGSQTYQRTCPTSSFEEYFMTGICDTTIDEMSYGIYTETTHDLRTLFALTFKNDFMDAAILQTCETQTEEDPVHWFGIKYARLYLHASIFQPRDTVYSELSGTRVDEAGYRTIFQVRRTIETPLFPAFPHVVRFDHQMGWVFSELPDRRIQFTIIGHLDPHGNMPAWVFNKMTPKKHAASCTMFSELVRLRRLVEAPSKDTLWVVDGSPRRCTMCPKNTKHWKYCRCCGQVTCRKCLLTISQPLKVTWSKADPARHISHPMDKAVYCKACFKAPPNSGMSEHTQSKHSSITSNDFDTALTVSSSQGSFRDSALHSTASEGPATQVMVTRAKSLQDVNEVPQATLVGAFNPAVQESLAYQRLLVEQMQRSLVVQQNITNSQ
ncbi:hypothetical protein THRCLA_06868 [Thraustotheca clavata]|uniref:START domain-containing protein n=1 Tax=Thraustotheca clavata TaxID=74557 RepID=A0A1V9ZIE6_9STRA|nr:hypothetical protein THRCLA_06868 [Thraustotheca clavata]